jgi:predicted flap endonuclease-1-like 5' DNA nuclease
MATQSNLRANFYKSDNGVDLVELKLIGDPNTVIYRVKDKEEQLKEQFPKEYAEYFKVKPAKKTPKATPLNVLKDLGKRKEDVLKLEGIKSVEELASLSDGACHGLGKGTLDLRKMAKDYLAEKYDIQAEQVVG